MVLDCKGVQALYPILKGKGCLKEVWRPGHSRKVSFKAAGKVQNLRKVSLKEKTGMLKPFGRCRLRRPRRLELSEGVV